MDFAKRIATLRKRLDREPALEPLLAELDGVDDKMSVAAIVKELEKSFERYANEAKKPITGIRFYWAGAEVAPWVPADVMGNVYAKKELLLDCAGGFTPIPMMILYNAVEEDAALGDHDAFDDLRELFVTTSLSIAQKAVISAVRGKAFAAMTIERPLTITARPGHDEPSVELFTVV